MFNSSANSGPEKTGLLDKYLVLWSSEFGLGHNRSAYCFTIWMAGAGNKGFEFQRDLLSHNLQYLKKSPRPALGVGLSFA